MRRPRISRRGLLAGGAVTTAGALTACGTGSGRGGGSRNAGAEATAATIPGGSSSEPFHGVHQAGIATAPQTYAVFVGLDLLPGTDREAIVRLLKLLTDDARRLMAGRPALADPEPDLARLPARLTVTIGFGPGLFSAAKAEDGRPDGIAPLPAFKIDRLEQRWSGGDLLLQICSDDALTLAHALRTTVRDTRAFCRVRWTQRGFRRSPQVQAPGQTQRNLMGQLDGTINPVPGTTDFDAAVWVGSGGPQWLQGGTTMVVRRIRMELEKWDSADRVAKEFAVGRRLDNGAPLTGRNERDQADYTKLDKLGFPVIAEEAHIRRAHVTDPRSRILRRGYNYDEGLSAKGGSDSGLLFVSYQADIDRQFLPIQRRLADADMLNPWTTPIGSAVFALPPGCSSTGWIGQTLLG